MVEKEKLLETEKIEIGDLVMLERYIELLWNFIPLPLCDINQALVIINVGKRFLEFLDYQEEEIIGESIEKIFSSKEEFKKFQKELFEKGEIWQQEFELLTKKGEKIPVLVFTKTRSEEGVILSYFIAFVDLRELKEKERRLEEKIKELEKFHRLAVGRELKMVELKKELKILKEKIEK